MVKYQLVELCDVGSSPISREVNFFSFRDLKLVFKREYYDVFPYK